MPECNDSSLVITYAASQFFGRASAQERDADVLREMRLSALRDRIRVIPRDELDRDVNRQ